jgi:hypothetical protein
MGVVVVKGTGTYTTGTGRILHSGTNVDVDDATLDEVRDAGLDWLYVEGDVEEEQVATVYEPTPTPAEGPTAPLHDPITTSELESARPAPPQLDPDHPAARNASRRRERVKQRVARPTPAEGASAPEHDPVTEAELDAPDTDKNENRPKVRVSSTQGEQPTSDTRYDEAGPIRPPVVTHPVAGANVDESSEAPREVAPAGKTKVQLPPGHADAKVVTAEATPTPAEGATAILHDPITEAELDSPLKRDPDRVPEPVEVLALREEQQRSDTVVDGGGEGVTVTHPIGDIRLETSEVSSAKRGRGQRDADDGKKAKSQGALEPESGLQEPEAGQPETPPEPGDE